MIGPHQYALSRTTASEAGSEEMPGELVTEENAGTSGS